MKSNILESPLKIYSKIPENWPSRPYLKLYNKLPESDLYEDGWRDAVTPSFDSATHRLGDWYYDAENDIVTRPKIALTDEEIKNRVMSQAEGDRENAIQKKLKKQAEAEFQAITDDQEALDNQAAFPFWKEDIAVLADEKYQAFDGVDLKLYKVVQGHTTQLGWEPNITPALFTRIAPPGEILEWVQPTGAQDAYNTEDRVIYEGQTWESTVDANVYAPGVVEGQWVVVP